MELTVHLHVTTSQVNDGEFLLTQLLVNVCPVIDDASLRVVSFNDCTPLTEAISAATAHEDDSVLFPFQTVIGFFTNTSSY